MGERVLQIVGAETWETIVAGAQAGSRADRARLVRALAPRVATVLRRTLGPDPELDDLAQDTLSELLRGLARVRSPALVVPFAERIAVNLARSRLRRRRVLTFLGFHELVTDDDTDAGAEAQVPDSTQSDPEARAAVRELYAVLDRFPADERLAFVLRHVERYSLEETAERLGCSLATAKRRLSACEARLEAKVPKDGALAAWLEKSS